jgi:hypothetical protein
MYAHHLAVSIPYTPQIVSRDTFWHQKPYRESGLSDAVRPAEAEL